MRQMLNVCMGGPKHGTAVDAVGAEILFPFADADWVHEMAEWDREWLVADTWLYLDGDYERLAEIPPKPRMPVWVYRWGHGPYGSFLPYYSEERR